jgi:hypothetical protein
MWIRQRPDGSAQTHTANVRTGWKTGIGGCGGNTRCLQMSALSISVHIPLRYVPFDAGDDLCCSTRIDVEKCAFRSLGQRLEANERCSARLNRLRHNPLIVGHVVWLSIRAQPVPRRRSRAGDRRTYWACGRGTEPKPIPQALRLACSRQGNGCCCQEEKPLHAVKLLLCDSTSNFRTFAAKAEAATAVPLEGVR